MKKSIKHSKQVYSLDTKQRRADAFMWATDFVRVRCFEGLLNGTMY